MNVRLLLDEDTAVVLCRPDAWGRVSFAPTPVSILGWMQKKKRRAVSSFWARRGKAWAADRLHGRGLRQGPVDDRRLRGRRERGRNPTLKRGGRRGRGAQQRRITPKGATSTKSVGKSGTVTKAAACKSRCRS
jgi:hypothetical protein